MNAKLLGEKILLKIEEPKEVKKGGIIIPDTAKEKPQEGKVVLVGPGRETDEGKVIPMKVKVGDIVFYDKYSGTEIKIDNEEYVLIKQEQDILLIK
ncbi:co-chaperone GroES [bacterium]